MKFYHIYSYIKKCDQCSMVINKNNGVMIFIDYAWDKIYIKK